MKKYTIFAASFVLFLALGVALLMTGPKPDVAQAVSSASPSPSSADYTTGLVGWWKLDDGSGSTALDSSGAGNTGTLVGSTAWTPSGKINGALGLSGGAVDAGNAASLSVSAVTMCAWVNSSATNDTNWHGIMAKRDDSQNPPWAYGINFNKTYGYFQVYTAGSGGVQNFAGYVLPDNTWTHICGVIDNTGTSLYVNGSLFGKQGTGGLATNPAHLFLGSSGGTSGSPIEQFYGTIDDARVYNRALTATDIAGLYSYNGFTSANGGGTNTGVGSANLSGWAWSSNIGWVSFNSKDYGTPDCQAYCVQVSNANGLLTGYAWSSSIGWIKFGGLSNIPGAGSNAYVSTSTGTVTGFIRACEGTLPGDCSAMTKRGDGWDGWIELSGVNHPSPDTSGYQGTSTKGVSFGAGNIFSGYAWGGDVVGWLSFDAGILGTPPVSCPGCGTGGSYISASCSIPTNPTSLSSGGGSVIATGSATGGAGSYTYAWSMGSGFTTPASSNTYNFTIPANNTLITQSYTLSVTAYDKNNLFNSKICGTVNVAPAPAANNVSLWVNKATTPTQTTIQVKPGANAPIFWSSSGMQSCSSYVLSSPNSQIPSLWTNGGSLPGTNQNSSPYNVKMPYQAGTYKLAIQCQSNTKDSNGNFFYVPTNYTDTTYNGQPIQTQVNVLVSSSTLIEF